MNATHNKASIFDNRSGSVRWVSSILNPLDLKARNKLCKALHNLFQAAKAKARGYRRTDTIKAIIYLLTGKLDFSRINPHYFTHSDCQRAIYLYTHLINLNFLPGTYPTEILFNCCCYFTGKDAKSILRCENYMIVALIDCICKFTIFTHKANLINRHSRTYITPSKMVGF